MSVFTER